MEWTGSLTDGDNLIKGKIKIPNLSEENEPEDITVSSWLLHIMVSTDYLHMAVLIRGRNLTKGETKNLKRLYNTCN